MVRKRTIIAIIITILLVILSGNTWLVFKPVAVDFDIQSKGKYNIEVQLNKKDNDEFAKIKSANDTFDLDKVSHVHLEIKRIKKPKRLRIILSGIDNPNKIKIKIKNIYLNNKLTINNLEKTDFRGGGLTGIQK